jgi:hypothetical protein
MGRKLVLTGMMLWFDRGSVTQIMIVRLTNCLFQYPKESVQKPDDRLH